MPQFEPLLLTYLHLAQASERRGQPLVRDKLLVLVGVTALELDWDEISAGCRQRILLHNPQHLVRRWPDLASAARTGQFRAYFKQLRRKYSPEKAEHMLNALGISLDERTSPGQSLREYAAALLESIAPEPSAARQGSAPLSGQRPVASGRFEAASPPGVRWWPFWLGLAVWIVLTLIVAFGRTWSA